MFPNVIVGEYINLWRFEYWKWWLPHETYDPVNNGRLHLFGKLYFGIIPFSLVTMYKVKSSIVASQLFKQSSIILSISLGLSITPRLYSTFLAEVLRSSTDLCHLTFLVLLIQVSLFFNFNIKPQYQCLKEL